MCLNQKSPMLEKKKAERRKNMELPGYPESLLVDLPTSPQQNSQSAASHSAPNSGNEQKEQKPCAVHRTDGYVGEVRKISASELFGGDSNVHDQFNCQCGNHE